MEEPPNLNYYDYEYEHRQLREMHTNLLTSIELEILIHSFVTQDFMPTADGCF